MHQLLASLSEREWHAFLAPVFAFSVAWGIGSTLSTESVRAEFSIFIERQFETVFFAREGMSSGGASG